MRHGASCPREERAALRAPHLVAPAQLEDACRAVRARLRLPHHATDTGPGLCAARVLAVLRQGLLATRAELGFAAAADERRGNEPSACRPRAREQELRHLFRHLFCRGAALLETRPARVRFPPAAGAQPERQPDAESSAFFDQRSPLRTQLVDALARCGPALPLHQPSAVVTQLRRDSLR